MKSLFTSLLVLLALLCRQTLAAETLVYKKAGDRELRLHIEKPADWKAADKRPAIVFFFGGGWVGGTPEQFRGQSEHFAARGMVGIRVEYRTIPKGDKGPPLVCCADAKSAMRYVRGHATDLGVDPARIAAAGGSAGGHLAAFTALVDGLDDAADDLTIPCKPDALVLFNPVFNNGPGQWGHERAGERFREFSPAHHITRSAPPSIVFLGDADKLIPVSVLREFEAAMKAAGVRCDAHVYPGAGHGFFNKEPHKSQTLAESDKFLTSLGWLTSRPAVKVSAPPAKPNVLLILADDLGYGDVRCYNPDRGKIPTPHLDGLAARGMRFTDAHTSSGVCSPTRYALLTGRYHWRTRLQSGIVGYLEKPLIAPGRLTLASLLKQHGYHTGMVGKWHLGWDWNVPPETRQYFGGGRGAKALEATDAHRAVWQDYFSKPIGGGPVARGFDEYFGTDVPNWPPYCFIENDRTVGIPGEFLPASALVKNQASLPGPALAGWKLEGILPALGDRACTFIGKSAKQPAPFFLYLPLTSPHTPIAVNNEWRGKSGLNDYADFVMETDAIVGRVLDALEKSGAAEKTLVLFTSDNGCAPYAGVAELQAKGHFPSGPLRGYKADAWEGGHRVPFIVRWPGVVAPGTRCDALVQQTDVMATLAETLDAKLPDNAGEDSVSLMPLLRGGDQPLREYAISHASSGLPSMRKGPWKIIFGQNGGGFAGAPGVAETGQFYDLATDLGETKNLWSEKPELVAGLTADMERLVADGRSTPGAKQQNDVAVKWRRFLK